MKTIRREAMFFGLFMVMLLLSACFTDNSSALTGGDVAPDFRAETLEGKEIVLSALLEDKKAVLVFWASWCPHCVAEIPHIEKFYKEKGEEIAVVSINVQESKAKVGLFVNKMAMSYPIALDTDGSVSRLYEVRGVPTIVAISEDGRVIYYGHSMEDMIRKLGF